MRKLFSFLIRVTSKIVGAQNLEKLLIFSAKSINSNLHDHGLLQIGAGTTVYLENGGELFFIREILPSLLRGAEHPVIFDVGANIGNYTLSLVRHITNGNIYAFEPVKKTFNQLEINVGDKASLQNLGFSDLTGKGHLYNTVNTSISEIATMHKEVLFDVFKNEDEIEVIDIDFDTIDSFCFTQAVKTIDFLKIDVEGNELAVLRGATVMLSNGSIKIIQFEFNTHNVYSRVFLRDFYVLLNQFNFYRLKSNGLLSLGAYNPKNEIFTAQNIIAVHKTLITRINRKYLINV